MLRNYLKVGLRSLMRNKTYVFINVLGLSVAIAVSLIIYLNYRHALDSNKEHAHYKETFKVNGSWVLNGEETGIGIAPLPLGKIIEQDLATVESAVRYQLERGVVKQGEDVFGERIAYVDKSFFNVFDFEFLDGSPEAVKDPGQIIISKNMSIRLFDEERAVGRDLRILSNGQEFLYTVGGVLDEIPTNSSFRSEAAFISFDTYYDHYPEIDRNDWGEWVDGLFLKLKNAEDRQTVESQLSAYLDVQQEANRQLSLDRYYIERIDEWAHTERYLRHGQFNSGMAPSAVWGLNSSAILILLLSCFNFTNTSISFSNKRLKEIGIRKVFGGRRVQLVTQFLIENFLLIMLALVLGIVLAELLLPAYNNLFWFIRLELDLLSNLKLLVFLVVLLIVVAIFSAIYPALYVSSFRPVNILRGRTKFGAGNKFLRILIASQFVITVYNIFSSIVFYQNGQYQTTLDQGYDMHKAIVVPISGDREYNTLRNELLGKPGIASVAGSQTQLAFSTSFAVIEREQQEFEVGLLRIGIDYIETMGISILEGRDFVDGLDSHSTQRVLINEELAKTFGWEYDYASAIDQRLYLDSAYYNVIGVVKNFHEKMLFRGGDIRPVVITLTDPNDFKYLTARTDGQNIKEVEEVIRSSWSEVFPYAPYEGIFQSMAIEVVEDTNYIIDRINLAIVAISILLSSIGLYTLVSLNIIKRIKEIGIRKVLGASVVSIIQLLNRNFAGLLLVGVVIGSVSGYFVMDWLLSVIYAYRLPIDLWPIMFSTLLLVVVCMTTVGGKVYNAAKINPVDHLRNE